MHVSRKWLFVCVLALVVMGGRPAGAQSTGIWISAADLRALPTSGSAWNRLLDQANRSCSTPDLEDIADAANVCVMAKALVFARTGSPTYRLAVVDALWDVVGSGTYNGRALALGRELAAYVIAADLIDLRGYMPALDSQFRSKIFSLVRADTQEAGSIQECHERRPNNWGTHCGASRAAVAAYLRDAGQLARVAQVFRGWLGDRSAYAGFRYGDPSWQCNPDEPVGINPVGCLRDGHPIDGVLPDDQRRGGGFQWPPPRENYVYEALQGALVQAVILDRAGYDAFSWENGALLRAFTWLHDQAHFPAEGDDAWQPHIINYFYRVSFPAVTPARPGKNMGWVDWTLGW
jgi:hypothetical protein